MVKILVVDDDSTFCIMLKTFLTKNGFEVKEAFSFDEAVRLIRTNTYDILLSDFRMPEGSGMEHDLALLRSELEKETKVLNGFELPLLDRLEPGRVDAEVLDQVDEALRTLTQHYRTAYKTAEAEKELLIAELTGTPELRGEYFARLDAFRNESLAEVVTNKNDVNVIVEYHGELVQKSDPVYLEPRYSGFFGAQFYAPSKYLGSVRVPTLWANTLVLWGMSLLLAIALYSEVFLRLLNALPRSGRR